MKFLEFHVAQHPERRILIALESIMAVCTVDGATTIYHLGCEMRSNVVESYDDVKGMIEDAAKWT